MALKNRKQLYTYLVSILYLLIVAVSYNSLNPTFARFGQWVSFIGFGFWIILRYKSKVPIRYPRILFPISIYVAVRFSSVLLAPFPILSFELVLKELTLLFGFIFVFDTLQGIWQPGTWENALINYGLAFSFVELLLAYFWHNNWWQITGTVFSLPPEGYRSPGVFLGHPNVMAGFLNLIVPIMLVRLFQERDWKRRALWVLGLIFIAITFYFTSSRTGLLAGILGAGTTIALFYGPGTLSKLLGNKRLSLRDVIPLRYLMLAIPLLILGLGFIYFFFVQSQTMATHAPTIISARSGIWEPAFEIIKQSPLLGHGPGSFSPFFAQETKIPPGFATSHAHNIFLQTAAETGILGVLLVLGIIIGVILAFLRTWRGASPSVKFRLAAYAGAGIAVLSHHMLDYLFESPIYAISVLIILALALNESPQSEKWIPRSQKTFLLPTSFLIAILFGSIYTAGDVSGYWSGINAGREGDWEKAVEGICHSYEKQPSITLYGFQCSLANAQLYYQTGDPQTLETATTLQRKLLESDPYWPVHWANLAIYEWISGESAAAIEHMQFALDLAPINPTFAINLARMRESIGETESAIDAYLSALKIDISLQFNQLFQDSPLAQEALALYRQDPAFENRRYLSIQGWEELLSNQYAKAETLFKQAIDANRADSRAYAGLAIVEQRSGQQDEALHNARIAIFISGTSPYILQTTGDILLEQGLEDKAYQKFQGAFNLIEERDYSSSYYYRTYNRFFLISDLAPQMLRGNITPSMVESFNLLAQYLEDNGKEDEALKVRRRIELELGAWRLPILRR